MSKVAMDFLDKSFCVLPWMHLATHPIGVVTPCCISDMTDGASDAIHEDGERMFLLKDKLPSITNSVKFNKIRKQMLENIEPSVCRNCYFYEKNNVGSKRSASNIQYQKYIDECFANTNPDGSLKKIDYRYIELRLGAVCNLKCVSCNSYSSSKWNEDTTAFYHTKFRKLYPNVNLGEPDMQWYRSTKFYDELFLYCDKLEEIWINGGEPTLIKEHGYFLQKFIDEGRSKNISLHYSLNVTQFPDKFIKLWKEFSSVKIHLSIDDFGDRNEYIRYPSKWALIFKNLGKIHQYNHIFNLTVLQTVSLLNICNIAEFGLFTKKINMKWDMNFVHYPNHLQVKHLPEELKAKVREDIKVLNGEEKVKILTELNQEQDPNALQDFVDFVTILDSQRKNKITDHLPEWKPYFKHYE